MIVDATSLRAARLEAPPSKSDAHRAFALAWMLKLPPPQLRAWPTDVRRIADGLALLGTGQTIDCGDGAAPFRILLALAATMTGRSVFTGTPRLAERPHAPLFRALKLEQTPWPLTVEGRGPSRAFAVEGELSSQYASALTLAACRAHLELKTPTQIDLLGPTASRGYLDLTVRWARHAGFTVTEAANMIRVEHHAPVAALPPVPPDWSSLGYLLLLALATGSDVDARGASEHPDRTLLQHLANTGLAVHHRDGLLHVKGEPRSAVDADIAASPDLAPTLAALALSARGGVLRQVSVLRHKESDRLAAIMELGEAVGARATLSADDLELTPAPRPTDFRFDCRDDHRLTLAAVSLACLFRCRAELSRTAGVDKSFPGFFEQLGRLKAGIA